LGCGISWPTKNGQSIASAVVTICFDLNPTNLLEIHNNDIFLVRKSSTVVDRC
jgi:hypothetical protein